MAKLKKVVKKVSISAQKSGRQPTLDAWLQTKPKVAKMTPVEEDSTHSWVEESLPTASEEIEGSTFRDGWLAKEPQAEMVGEGSRRDETDSVIAKHKGKQQRDRRKLREKRRSTGVVHLASTESTGGSTTGDDEEGGEILGLCSETRRNTQQNESVASNPGCSNEAAPAEPPERKNSGHHKLNSPQSQYTSQGVAKSRLRDKSPRSEDLESDDEQGDKTDNDHDSLNLSESSSTVSIIAPSAVTPQDEKEVQEETDSDAEEEVDFKFSVDTVKKFRALKVEAAPEVEEEPSVDNEDTEDDSNIASEFSTGPAPNLVRPAWLQQYFNLRGMLLHRHDEDDEE